MSVIADLIREQKPCFVYLIVAEAPVLKPYCDLLKVGISDNPNGRLASIKTASPFHLSMPFIWKLPSREAAFSIESNFHKECAEQRTSGEWFLRNAAASACDIGFSIVAYHRNVFLGKTDDEIGEVCGQDIDDLLSFLSFVGMDSDSARDIAQAVYGEVEAI